MALPVLLVEDSEDDVLLEVSELRKGGFADQPASETPSTAMR